MHIFFSGIGGTGLGPLALIAYQAGYAVSGSDAKDSKYISYLRHHGITNIEIGQTVEQIAATHAHEPIDWFVYSSAVAIENPNSPEFRFCRAKHIKESKRDVLLNMILADRGMKLMAIAGTHGKTTTTAMAVWLCKRLNVAISYSVGAKLSFGEMGEFDPSSQLFIYEADEFDRNFLAFQPYLSVITGIGWDHHDIYPTRQDYQQAFEQFIAQSSKTIIWQEDTQQVHIRQGADVYIADKYDPAINANLTLTGTVNRQNAWQVAVAIQSISGQPYDRIFAELNKFPGVSRRFEQIAPNLYSDYAHTPPKIRGTLDTVAELARRGSLNIVVVYEGLHNTRQHFIKAELATLFDDVNRLYIVPTYLAREDKSLAVWTPQDIKNLMSPATQAKTQASQLDDRLKNHIASHLAAGDIVVAMSAGGGGSLDEWLRKTFATETAETTKATESNNEAYDGELTIQHQTPPESK